MSRNLILWFIDEQHRAEQQVSEASVKRWMPDVDILCMQVVRSRNFPHWYENYILALRQSLDTKNSQEMWYEKIIFLDSDTYLTESIEDVFEILDKYDVVSTHAPARQTTDMPLDSNIPDGYCEFNTGLFGYANTSQVRQLFDWWLEEYYKMYSVSGDNDQSALRAAMWRQGTNAWVLPPEYNARLGFGMFASGAIKLLHIRYPHASMEQIATWANQNGNTMRLLSSKDLPK